MRGRALGEPLGCVPHSRRLLSKVLRQSRFATDARDSLQGYATEFEEKKAGQGGKSLAVVRSGFPGVPASQHLRSHSCCSYMPCRNHCRLRVQLACMGIGGISRRACHMLLVHRPPLAARCSQPQVAEAAGRHLDHHGALLSCCSLNLLLRPHFVEGLEHALDCGGQGGRGGRHEGRRQARLEVHTTWA